MRVSTAVFYTIAALLAKDIAAPAIASTPVDAAQTSDLPNFLTPDVQSSVSELVAPIAPVETIVAPPASIQSSIPPAEVPPETIVPVKSIPTSATSIGITGAKPSLPSLPEIVKEAASSPNLKPNSAAESSPDTKPVLSTSPSPASPIAQTPSSDPPNPTLQTIGEGELTEQIQAGQADLSTASHIQINALTETESAPPAPANEVIAQRSTLSLDTLLVANLAEAAIVAFEPSTEAADNNLQAETMSVCEAILNPQMLPTGVCPPVPVIEHSAIEASTVDAGSVGQTTEGETDNANETAETTAALTQANSSAPANHTHSTTSYTNPTAYSVYDLQPSGSARDYYNLSIRPPAQFSNGNLNLLFPLSIPAPITSAFGWRTHPITGDARFHTGTDIGAPQGTPVLAAFDGKVEISDFMGGYGLTVVLQHHDGTEQTLYAHLSEVFVRSGEQVKQGEVIGRVGSTGLSTGPHLHFEFRRMSQEGWMVMNAGPALEYALAQIIRSPHLAQKTDRPNLPTVFQYSGKFLDLVKIASQPKPNQGS
jgi:murein DD-endopeptidase MepM/ murein hydrolase activator NlpD